MARCLYGAIWARQERSRYWLRHGHFQTSHSWFTKLVETGGKSADLPKPSGTVLFNHRVFSKFVPNSKKILKNHKNRKPVLDGKSLF
jgi:hypothetical protein